MLAKVCCLSFLIYLINIPAINAAKTIGNSYDTSQPNSQYTNLLTHFTLGQPTNGVCVGILNPAQPKLSVCLLCVGQTNRNQFWIAPPQFQRVEYYLYDSSTSKLVPYQKTYHTYNKVYNRIYDVPKNSHNAYQGVMWPPFSMPYDQITLTNVFNIGHGGEYKLIARARIMKINRNSSLSVVEFPPVSLTIHVRDQDVAP